MTQLFYKELPKLKLFFYQLDRLIGILLPEVHDHFKEEMINSAHFSSSWFITIFSSVLHTREELYQLWDLFIFDGWKIVFKASIAILAELSDVIITSAFEDIVTVLNNVATDKCPIQIFTPEFVEKVRKIKISDSLLRDLESEFEHLRIRASANPKRN
jgi:hypothetical protein